MAEYYISDGKKESGPFTIEKLKNIPITKDYLVWKQGMTKWVKITEVVELNEIIYSVPPPISKHNDQIIRSYLIKHFIITFVILILIILYANDLVWGYYINEFGLSTGDNYTNITVFVFILITIIMSIIIFKSKLNKLNK